MSRRLFLMVTVVLMAVACSEQPSPVLLGPDEMVIGRSLHAGHVRLLTSRRRVITMKLADGVTVAHRLKGLSVDEAVWGLARSADGRLWTLAGTSQLAEIDQGDIARRLPTSRRLRRAVRFWRNAAPPAGGGGSRGADIASL